tara:strand:- start:2052 stop:2423 length:372 start_codon:yes stop_codon:yes gene_type:complete
MSQISQQQVWINNLTNQQKECVECVLKDLTLTNKDTYSINNFPEHFIQYFNEAFVRKDWLNSLTPNQIHSFENDLQNKKLPCPKIMCCENCHHCNGSGNFTYQLSNFPIYWIDTYNAIFANNL